MIKESDFKKNANNVIEWLESYFNNIENYPVLSKVLPGEIERSLPTSAPNLSESFEQIFTDFDTLIMPGITHWQHPGFHAYFPANSSEPSVLAELLTAGLGVQGMKWLTSPAATELEKVVMKWLQKMIALPDNYKGVLMDTASVSTLCAVLAARERASDYSVNKTGLSGTNFRIYCSLEAHSSIEKAVRIAGIGSNNLIKIPVDNKLAMLPDQLEQAIEKDISSGYMPICVIGALGTTGTCAMDPLAQIGAIAGKYNLWYHIDAAYAGTALVIEDFRKSITDYTRADSFVFNPHKWMFTNFDCSAFYVRNSKDLTKTFSLVPEYLQSDQEEEYDYSNWSIQLGRRFRSLKLWFVIRSYGVDGIKQRINQHIELGKSFEEHVIKDSRFELVVPRNLNLVCFRLPGSDESVNELNKKLLNTINNSGKVFLSHTIINDKFVLRFVCGQTNVEKRHIDIAWEVISESVNKILNK